MPKYLSCPSPPPKKNGILFFKVIVMIYEKLKDKLAHMVAIQTNLKQKLGFKPWSPRKEVSVLTIELHCFLGNETLYRPSFQ